MKIINIFFSSLNAYFILSQVFTRFSIYFVSILPCMYLIRLRITATLMGKTSMNYQGRNQWAKTDPVTSVRVTWIRILSLKKITGSGLPAPAFEKWI